MQRAKTKKEKLTDISIALAVYLSYVGVSIGGLIKYSVGINITWISTAITLLALVLFLPGIRPVFLKPNREIALVFAYSAITLVLSFLTPTNVQIYSSLYQVVYFAQILLLWNRRKDLRADTLVSVFFWCSLAVSALALYLLLRERMIYFNILLNNTAQNRGVSRTTIGAVAYVGFVSSLAFRAKKRMDSIARIAGLILGVILLGLSTRRSSLIAAACSVIIYYLSYKETHGKRLNKKLMARIAASIFTVFAVGLILYHTNAAVKTQVDRLWLMTTNGIETYIGRENTDLSASYRRTYLDQLPQEYVIFSSAKEFFLGKGYMYEWLDIPFVQAFIDLGLFGGLLFFLIAAVYPVKHLVSKKKTHQGIMLAKYILTLELIRGFVSGAPYGRFLALVLIVVMEKADWKEEWANESSVDRDRLNGASHPVFGSPGQL